MGGLHTETAILYVLGDWLEGSDWSTALVDAGVTTAGKAEALLIASYVKRTCYAHQVTVSALHILQQSAFEINV